MEKNKCKKIIIIRKKNEIESQRMGVKRRIREGGRRGANGEASRGSEKAGDLAGSLGNPLPPLDPWLVGPQKGEREGFGGSRRAAAERGGAGARNG